MTAATTRPREASSPAPPIPLIGLPLLAGAMIGMTIITMASGAMAIGATLALGRTPALQRLDQPRGE